MVSTNCTAMLQCRACSARHALAGIAIATLAPLRHRLTTDSGTDIMTLVTGKTCLGGGMNCPNASSCHCCLSSFG